MNKKEKEIKIKSLIGEKEFRNYKNFAFREDMFKLTVGVILANSLNKVVYGFSDHLVMPIFKFCLSKTGDGWRTWKFSPLSGLDFEIGNLLATVVDFILISIVLYLFYIKLIRNLFGSESESQSKKYKECKYCCGEINQCAVKCPLCTGDLSEKPRRSRSKNKRAKNS